MGRYLVKLAVNPVREYFIWKPLLAVMTLFAVAIVSAYFIFRNSETLEWWHQDDTDVAIGQTENTSFLLLKFDRLKPPIAVLVHLPRHAREGMQFELRNNQPSAEVLAKSRSRLNIDAFKTLQLTAYEIGWNEAPASSSFGTVFITEGGSSGSMRIKLTSSLLPMIDREIAYTQMTQMTTIAK